MEKLGFFTPVRWNDADKGIKQHISEGIDGYFSPVGKKVAVITGDMVKNSQPVEISTDKRYKLLSTVIKIITYLTVIIPLIMLVVKAIYRLTHQFHVSSPKSEAKIDTKRINPIIVNDLLESIQIHKFTANEFLKNSIDSLDLSSIDGLMRAKNIFLQIDNDITFFKEINQKQIEPKQKVFVQAMIDKVYKPLRKQFHEKVKGQLDTFIATLQEEYSDLESGKETLDLERVNDYFLFLELIGKIKPEAIKGLNRPTPGNPVVTPGVNGIPNIGNSCYMNSTMQMLLASPELIQRIKTHVVSKNLDQFEDRQRILSLLKLFVELIETGNKDLIKQVATALRLQVFESNFDFDFDKEQIGAQQDAARFADILFRVLEYSTPYKTILTAENDFNEKIEPYTSCAINIQNNMSFQQLIDSELDQHKVDDKWKEHSSYNKQLRIDGEPPENLVFTLKRFEYDEYGNQSKVNDAVEFPEDGIIEMKDAFGIEESVRYEVVSTVNHSGSLDGGHYISYTKREDQWYYASDSFVDPRKPKLEDAYVILLKRV